MNPRLHTVSAENALIDGTWTAATITLAGDQVATVTNDTSAKADLLLDGNQWLIPGVVDSHVHLGEPGHSDYEGFTTGTLAAAYGGVTTVLEMPMPSDPPTTSFPALALKASMARDRVRTNVGFYAGIVPENLGRLGALWERGVYGLVAITASSDMPSFLALDSQQLAAAGEEIAEFDGLFVIHPGQGACNGTPGSFSQWQNSHSTFEQLEVVADVLENARHTGVRVHILSVASAALLPLIAQAKADGVRVTAETSTPYLVLNNSLVGADDSHLGFNPVLGSPADQDALWAALQDGTLDMISSSHNPKAPGQHAWGDGPAGIWSVETTLPLIATAASHRGIELSKVAYWLSTSPARIIGSGVSGRGTIQPGGQADFAVYDTSKQHTIIADELHYKNPSQLFTGNTVNGSVSHTIVGGAIVEKDLPVADAQTTGSLIFKY